LQRIDPGRRVLALDLPGHDESPDWTSYDIESVADGVHRAVEQAQLQAPVVVGHSISAVIATVYAARYPSSGVINIDQSLQVAPFANLVRSLADKLRGPNFPALWENFAAGMQIELLPESAQALVRSTSRPRQELVVGYWRELLDRPTEELADLAAAALTTVRDAGLPYLVVAGNPLEPATSSGLPACSPRSKSPSGPEAVTSHTSLTPATSRNASPQPRSGRLKPQAMRGRRPRPHTRSLAGAKAPTSTGPHRSADHPAIRVQRAPT
jgi:pimeloyl-ACP methyl ester carboxylesterase